MFNGTLPQITLARATTTEVRTF